MISPPLFQLKPQVFNIDSIIKLPESITIIRTKSKGLGIVARNCIKKEETICKFLGDLVPQRKVRNPNAALQLDEDLFLESDGTIDENLNHSCDPNCYVDFKQLTTVALKDIHRGEELTFDYNTRPLKNVQFCSRSRKAKILALMLHCV